MSTTQQEVRQAFKDMFPVIRDLDPLRKSGVLLEDMAWEVRVFVTPEHGLVHVQGASYSSTDTGVFYSEAFYHAEDRQVGIYSAAAMHIGIPTYKVGVQNEEHWVKIREHLREKGMLRPQKPKQPKKYTHKYPNKLLTAKINKLANDCSILSEAHEHDEGEQLNDAFYLRMAELTAGYARKVLSDDDKTAVAKEAERLLLERKAQQPAGL